MRTQYILISDDFMCLLYRSKVHNGNSDLPDCKFYKSSFYVTGGNRRAKPSTSTVSELEITFLLNYFGAFY